MATPQEIAAQYQQKLKDDAAKIVADKADNQKAAAEREARKAEAERRLNDVVVPVLQELKKLLGNEFYYELGYATAVGAYRDLGFKPTKREGLIVIAAGPSGGVTVNEHFGKKGDIPTIKVYSQTHIANIDDLTTDKVSALIQQVLAD